MTVCRATGEIAHRGFADFPGLLAAGDLLVLNDTRVIRGRLRARKTTGGAVEIFLLSPLDAGTEGGSRWEALARPSARLKEGMAFAAGPSLRVTLGRRLGGGRWEADLLSRGPLFDAIEEAGEVPLPPYIRREPGDPRGGVDAERYQTVYAERPGSVAAPTAGLHFDGPLLDEIAGRGASVARVTLTVGYGTFAPIRTEQIEAFAIHPERYRLGEEAADAVAAARRCGGRVVAVGTTSVRTLETCAAAEGLVSPSRGETRLFITPGFRFRVVDALLTNFHLPRSSLLALVMAFAGVDLVREAYRRAIEAEYRFFSYGDAMFVR